MIIITYYVNQNRLIYNIVNNGVFSDSLQNCILKTQGNYLYVFHEKTGLTLLETCNYLVIYNHDEPGSDL